MSQQDHLEVPGAAGLRNGGGGTGGSRRSSTSSATSVDSTANFSADFQNLSITNGAGAGVGAVGVGGMNGGLLGVNGIGVDPTTISFNSLTPAMPPTSAVSVTSTSSSGSVVVAPHQVATPVRSRADRPRSHSPSKQGRKGPLKTVPYNQNPKKRNAACHLCDHAAQRPGRQKIALQVPCCVIDCRKVFCSRPSCVKKLGRAGLTGEDSFEEWKKRVESGKEIFVCPHCKDESSCPGPQCNRRWTKRKSRSRTPGTPSPRGSVSSSRGSSARGSVSSAMGGGGAGGAEGGGVTTRAAARGSGSSGGGLLSGNLEAFDIDVELAGGDGRASKRSRRSSDISVTGCDSFASSANSGGATTLSITTSSLTAANLQQQQNGGHSLSGSRSAPHSRRSSAASNISRRSSASVGSADNGGGGGVLGAGGAQLSPLQIPSNPQPFHLSPMQHNAALFAVGGADIPSLVLQPGFGVTAPIAQNQQQHLALLSQHHRANSHNAAAPLLAAMHQHQQQQQQQQFPAAFTTSPQMSTMQVPSAAASASRLAHQRHSVPSSPHARAAAAALFTQHQQQQQQQQSAAAFDFRHRNRLSPVRAHQVRSTSPHGGRSLSVSGAPSGGSADRTNLASPSSLAVPSPSSHHHHHQQTGGGSSSHSHSSSRRHSRSHSPTLPTFHQSHSPTQRSAPTTLRAPTMGMRSHSHDSGQKRSFAATFVDPSLLPPPFAQVAPSPTQIKTEGLTLSVPLGAQTSSSQYEMASRSHAALLNHQRNMMAKLQEVRDQKLQKEALRRGDVTLPPMSNSSGSSMSAGGGGGGGGTLDTGGGAAKNGDGNDITVDDALLSNLTAGLSATGGPVSTVADFDMLPSGLTPPTASAPGSSLCKAPLTNQEFANALHGFGGGTQSSAGMGANFFLSSDALKGDFGLTRRSAPSTIRPTSLSVSATDLLRFDSMASSSLSNKGAKLGGPAATGPSTSAALERDLALGRVPGMGAASVSAPGVLPSFDTSGGSSGVTRSPVKLEHQAPRGSGGGAGDAPGFALDDNFGAPPPLFDPITRQLSNGLGGMSAVSMADMQDNDGMKPFLDRPGSLGWYSHMDTSGDNGTPGTSGIGEAAAAKFEAAAAQAHHDHDGASAMFAFGGIANDQLAGELLPPGSGEKGGDGGGHDDDVGDSGSGGGSGSGSGMDVDSGVHRITIDRAPSSREMSNG